MSASIKGTIAVMNQMQADGVIGQYAIGGAVGAAFYLDPADTQDVDVFITLESLPGHSIVSLTPIYAYLRALGYRTEGEYIVVFDWPVQFLPASTPLLTEALEQSVVKDVDGVPARVFTAEHLAAIALDLGRFKDRQRLGRFLEARAVNEARLSEVLKRHGLLDRWFRFKKGLGG